MVRMLLQHEYSPNSKNSNGQTPLHLAAQGEHRVTLRLLPDQGARVDSEDSLCYQTPLSLAAGHRHSMVVELLIIEGSRAINGPDASNELPLTLAAREGHDAIVKILLRHGATIEWKDNITGTALSWAAACGHMGTALLLINKGAEIDTRNKEQQMLLIRAAKATTWVLVENEAKIDLQDEHGETSPGGQRSCAT